MNRTLLVFAALLVLGLGGIAIVDFGVLPITKDDAGGISTSTATTTDAVPNGKPNPKPVPQPKPVPTPTPTPKPTGNEVRLKAGERSDSVLVEKVYADHIEGRNFGEYPVATNEGYPLSLNIGEKAGNGCTVWLTLVRIEGTVAVFTREETPNAPCPICLSEGTRIDTPSGPVPVEALTEGMYVWTVDSSGKRVIAVILAAGKATVPETHEVIRITLADGREASVSARHPMSDGRMAGTLSIGDRLDQSTIVNLESIHYGKRYTYDILPAGGTGLYFANGILMMSTLHR